MDPAPFFETTRLRVRRFVSADLHPFVAYRANPEVARYQSWSDYTEDQGAALIESMRGAEPGIPGEWYQLALEEKDSGELIGDLALKVDADEPRIAEVGFTLAPAHQGKGYGAEALGAILGWAFETLGLHRIYAVTDALNVPAAILLERVGFRREAHFHENVWFKGAWGSELLFAILEREWAAGT
jgi:RimJ/RimL family protein N-acetyltransferase